MRAEKNFSILMHGGKVVFVGNKVEAEAKMQKEDDITDALHSFEKGAEFDFSIYGKDTQDYLVERGYIGEIEG